MLSRFINIAIEQATNSTLVHRHGAILFSRRSIISKGFNQFVSGRQRYTSISIHAEMNCLREFHKHTKYKRCHILVVRLNSNLKLVNSKPCRDCMISLLKMGIKNVYYSDESGNIVCEKIKHMTSTHISSGTRYWKG